MAKMVWRLNFIPLSPYYILLCKFFFSKIEVDAASHLTHSQNYKVSEGKRNSYMFKVCFRGMRYVLLSYNPMTAKIEGWCWKQGLEHQYSHHTLIFFFTRLRVSLLPMCLYVFFRWNKFSALGCYSEKKLMMAASALASQFLSLKTVLRVALGCNILGMQTGIPLGIQSGSNWVFYIRIR